MTVNRSYGTLTPEQFDRDYEIVSRVEYVGPPTRERRFKYDNVLYIRPRRTAAKGNSPK